MSYDGGWTAPAVPLTALTPYLGRFVRFEISRDGLDTTVRGFLTGIDSGAFVLDEGLDVVDQKYAVRAYNITGKLIAGKED